MTDAPMGLRPQRPLADIHGDAIHLAGLAHVLDNFGAMDSQDRNGVASLIAVMAPLARNLADDLEAVLP